MEVFPRSAAPYHGAGAAQAARSAWAPRRAMAAARLPPVFGRAEIRDQPADVEDSWQARPKETIAWPG